MATAARPMAIYVDDAPIIASLSIFGESSAVCETAVSALIIKTSIDGGIEIY